MPKNSSKKVSRDRKRKRERVDRRRKADVDRRHDRRSPLEDVWKGKEFMDGKDTDERLKKMSIPNVLSRFRRMYPDLAESLRPLIVHLGRPPGGRICKKLAVALTRAAWDESGDIPRFAPMFAISPSKEIRIGCVATEEQAVGDGMCLRYADYNPVMFLEKTGKVGSLSYRQIALDRLVAFLGKENLALLLDAAHGSAVRREVILDGNLLPEPALVDESESEQDEGNSHMAEISKAHSKIVGLVSELPHEDQMKKEIGILLADVSGHIEVDDPRNAGKSLDKVIHKIPPLPKAEGDQVPTDAFAEFRELLSSTQTKVQEEVGRRPTTSCIALWLDSGTAGSFGGRMFIRIGYLPLFMHEEKAFIVAESFMPCGAPGTPEHGADGMETMASPDATLSDLVSAYSSKETIFALANRDRDDMDVNPLVEARKEQGEQPSFGPLTGFVTNTDERLAFANSGSEE